MSKQDSPTKKARRRKKGHTSFETDEGWAVSYSDLLMVLMSFFIIYFNIDSSKESTKSEFKKIVLQLENITKTKKVSANFASKEEPKDREPASNKNIGLSGLLAESNEKTIEKKKEILIDLSDNLYGRNQFNLNKSVKSELDQVLDVIDASKNKLNIIFIGHTDKVKFNKSSTEVINNNIVLSSMRAARAVEYAIGKGFSNDQVFVQGTSQQNRNSRSLSIKLLEK